ncbi:MAG TPA: copper homeostasis membrane protein CopD [Casimicrobiaceae bacterium]|nr:copper homeostasis membrane protein CopD [Casimicrobiaceae bacterium]
MNAPFVAVRALHFGSAMLIFGELLFVSVVASSAWQRAVAARPGKGGALARHAQIVSAWALLVSAGSGAAWLAIEAANMAGTTLARAIDARTLALVLRETEFGHVWLLRTFLLVMLALSLVAIRRAADDAARSRRTRIALLLAALYLAMLAWAGHAAATMQGALRALHLASDMSHALAAGAWLGALPALVYCLRSTQPNAAMWGVTRRFSVLGVISVSVLLVTGIVNACFLVGSFAALFGTPYGRMLIVKLAVFAAMLALAAHNRWHLTPQLAHGDATARRSLRRSATLEVIGGVAIVTIVGVLGTMIPGAHQSPVWPFTFALDLSDIARPAIAALAVIALAALILIITGVRRRFARLWIPGSIALLLSVVASGWVLAVPAFPTTYATSPVPYSVGAVARGASTFANACSGCHGAGARGDGAEAASLPVKPVNLAEHASHHPQGNLFWWIAHGIPDTPMPAFSPALSEPRIWELVQFLVARASAAAAMSLGPRADVASTSTVPDFNYELPGQGQRTLSAERAPALIVLYSLPQSHARLDELASDHRVAHGNLRVVAIPFAGSQRAGETNALMQTRVDPEVASVYAMFAETADRSQASHVELLVDASGVLRARWIGLPASDSDRDAEILAAVKHLSARSTMPAMMHHAR